MTEIINRLNIKYKPWKIYGVKDDKKVVFAENSAEEAEKRKASLEKEGWTNVRIIAGKAEETPAEQEAA